MRCVSRFRPASSAHRFPEAAARIGFTGAAAAAFLFLSWLPAKADDGWAKTFTFPLASNTGDAGRGFLFHDPTDGIDYAYFGADTNNGAQVWRSSDGVSWNQVNINGFGSILGKPLGTGISWISSYFDGASTHVYAGASQNLSVPNGAQIYRSAGGSSANQWTLVFSSITTGDALSKDPGGGTGVTFNGAFYIGTRNNTNGGDVWKSTSADSTNSWIRVSASGFGEGPAANANISYLKVFGGNLYAATNCSVSGPPCGQIWKSTGTTNPTGIDSWSQVLTASNTFDSNTHSVSALENFNGFLYATTLNVSAHAQIFRSATPDVPASWQQVLSPDSACANCFSLTTSTEIHTLRAIGGILYASTWDSSGGLIVYRSTDGAIWTRSNTAGGFGIIANQYLGDFVGLGNKIIGDAFNTSGGALWSTVSTSTQTPPGQPVLAAAAQGVSSITWSWASVTNASGFEVLSSTFGNLSGVLSTTTLSWTELNLSTNATYTRYVMAFNALTSSTSTAVTRFTLAMPPTSTSFQGVFGSLITISWLADTNPAGTNYRVNLWQASGATVTTTVAVTTAALSSLIGQTTYFINVTAMNGEGVLSAPDVTLSTITQSVLVAIATVTANGPSVLVSINTSAGPALLSIPPQAFTSDVSLTLQVPGALPAGTASAAATLQAPGRGIQIVENTSAQPVKLVTLTVPYLASDITGMDSAKLVLARFDTTQNVWVPLESSVDPANSRVTALTNHLSMFQIMGVVPATTISNIKIFPNPFRPALGHQYVTFSNLPANTRLRIYTYSGDLVKDLTADLAGIATWDATNRAGNNVASGVYFVFTQGAGSEHTFKVAVQR